ncbi:hypothetical protein IFM89_016515 [Coptis chinensis]|uniref:Uncharacterized protein n=1 Tax=Coptis chinensis TaxID=261450 RepID=A0A835INT0_9MAGN|nr:hypothetical protein IFM89_016515 [Coptis chinensis]
MSRHSIDEPKLTSNRADLDLAEIDIKKALEIEPNNSEWSGGWYGQFENGASDDAYYVVLSNIYAALDRWEKAEKMRMVMAANGIQKEAGCSSIALANEFIAPHVSLRGP